jgi:hypothetical protein
LTARGAPHNVGQQRQPGAFAMTEYQENYWSVTLWGGLLALVLAFLVYAFG